MTRGDRPTLVLDIGKSNARLVLIDRHGAVLWTVRTANESTPDPVHGTTALGTDRLALWLHRCMPELPREHAPGRIAVSTHGAALCALGDDGLVLPPIDYEWDGYGDIISGFDTSLADFAHHGTPRLPQGLNAGRQIDYVMRRWPELDRRIRVWLPYAQYWTWWFSGVACSEVSSLGCHTGLWSPVEGRFSDWARSSGIANRFAPTRRAWDVIGTLRPALVAAWGLADNIEVIAGVHDSNACLARHLRTHPNATVVSTGTWCVVMAPGATIHRLNPERDELVNVAVDGRPVATARFMGGREFAALCDGSDPAGATLDALAEVLDDGWMALPTFADGGGPYRGRRGQILRHAEPVTGGVSAVPARLRPALASLYCAEVCARLVTQVSGADAAVHPVIVEGPLANNACFGVAMSSLLQPRPVLVSTDPLEGTARGAWMLAHWHEAPAVPLEARLQRLPIAAGPLLEQVIDHAHQCASRLIGDE